MTERFLVNDLVPKVVTDQLFVQRGDRISCIPFIAAMYSRPVDEICTTGAATATLRWSHSFYGLEAVKAVPAVTRRAGDVERFRPLGLFHCPVLSFQGPLEQLPVELVLNLKREPLEEDTPHGFPWFLIAFLKVHRSTPPVDTLARQAER